MANEAELERLVVRLIGDGSSFQRMMLQARTTSVTTTAAIEQNTEKVQNFGFGLRRFALHAVGAMGLFSGAVSLMGTSITSISNFAQAEAGLDRLNSTIRANGGNVEALSVSYGRFAEEIQRITVLDDDATLALLRTAETFGLTGEMAEGAARKAIALAGAVDGTATSAQSYLRIAAAVQQGDIQRAMMMSRMVPQLRGIKDETEFLTKFNQLLAVGLATTGGEINTLSGQWKQFHVAMDNALESIGEGVVNAFYLRGALSILTGAMREVEGFLKSLPAPLRNVIAWVGAGATAVTVFSLAWPVLSTIAGTSMATLKAPIVRLIALITGKTVATAAATAANVALAQSTSAVTGALTLNVTASRAAAYGMTLYASAASSAAVVPIAGVPVATAVGRWAQLGTAASNYATSLGGVTIGLTAAVAGGYALGTALYNSFPSVQRLADQMERLNRLSTRFGEQQSQGRSATLTAIRGVVDPKVRGQDAQAEMERLERELEGKRRNIAGYANREVRAIVTEGRMPTAGDLEIINRQLREMEAQAQATAGQIDELRKIQLAAADAIANQANVAYEEMIKKLTEEGFAIGRTADQQQLDTLRRLGASEAMLAQVRAMQMMNAERKEEAQLRDDVKKFNEDLIEQAALWGLVGRELEEARLRLRGWNGALSEGAQFARDYMDEMDAWQSDMEEVDRIIADTRTPFERFTNQLENLNRLHATGAMGAETYRRAVEKLTAEYEGLNQQAQKFDAVSLGSAEATARIAAFRDAVRGPTGRVSIAMPRDAVAVPGGVVAPPGAGTERTNDILEQMRELLARIANQPPIEVVEADLD